MKRTPKGRKTYLKNIRSKKERLKSIVISLLIAIAIFLSPVLYGSTIRHTSFMNELTIYVNNLSDRLSKSLSNLAKELLPSEKLNEMVVHFIDVGQGDASLIQVNGMNLLIDTGQIDQSSKLIAYLKSQGVRQIDVLLITHPHSDHMGGAVRVLDAFPVKKIYMTNYLHTTKSYENLLLKIKEKKLSITKAKKGGKIYLGQNVNANILAPGKEYTNINASSIVLKLDYGDTSFLFTGDATVETEQDILNDFKGEDLEHFLKSDVYKVAHHGSATSNSMRFLEKVRPELSIISVGEGNPYGHPHEVVLKRLRKINSIILTTKDQGTIRVYSDGQHISYKLKSGATVKLYQ